MTFPTSDPTPDLAELFAGAGVPEPYLAPAAARLGPDAARLLRADPWRLLLVPGVGPEQADHFARGLLGPAAEPADPRRGRALAVHLLVRAARHGHTALPVPELAAALAPLKVTEPLAAIRAALDEGEAMHFLEEVDFDALPDDIDEAPDPVELVGLARYALAEEAVAEGVMRLSMTAEPLPDGPTGRLAEALAHGVSVLHGSPGAVEAALPELVEAARAAGARVAVATATGRAAAGAGPAAVALHRLLEATGTGDGLVCARDEQRPVEADVVVALDAGWLDVETAAALVEACADGTRLMLCGDPAGLPPAGPGRVLADLAESGTVPVTDLGDGPGRSPLDALVAGVRRGDLPRVEAPDREVVVVPAADDAEAAHRAVQLVADSIPRALGVPADEVQVLGTGTAGPAGTVALNAALKERLNPGPGAHGGFDVGDRVLVAVALPEVPTGETGPVTGADEDGLTIEFPGGPVRVPTALLGRLRHGRAMTVGQAHGTRWPAVVAVVSGEAAGRLSGPLAVTAFTRGRRHLSIVHAAGPALARAVRESAVPARRTRLVGLLRG
ncbi:conjugal transfer protein TraA [Actinomadura craniellae]|uniref:Conjugal transfer protein TraA n=1 Tax=Actinomadura craniellae TaxID=2231787 RepID=A0A365H4H9_9ACTN|nr:AAA family ATPase [Actinomadura craniellae]RAY13959.1 conjugal transfer protein TraA [Actinomadura craniellae]